MAHVLQALSPLISFIPFKGTWLENVFKPSYFALPTEALNTGAFFGPALTRLLFTSVIFRRWIETWNNDGKYRAWRGTRFASFPVVDTLAAYDVIGITWLSNAAMSNQRHMLRVIHWSSVTVVPICSIEVSRLALMSKETGKLTDHIPSKRPSYPRGLISTVYPKF